MAVLQITHDLAWWPKPPPGSPSCTRKIVEERM
jgi:hypothetical protein